MSLVSMLLSTGAGQAPKQKSMSITRILVEQILHREVEPAPGDRDRKRTAEEHKRPHRAVKGMKICACCGEMKEASRHFRIIRIRTDRGTPLYHRQCFACEKAGKA